MTFDLLNRFLNSIGDRCNSLTANGLSRRRPPSRSKKRILAFEELEPIIAQAVLLSEGFESSFPTGNSWQVGDSNSSGTTAYWGRVNSAFGGEGTHSGSMKGYVAGVGYAGSSTTPNYRDSMTAYMQRSIDLSGKSSANLSFWLKTPSIETGYDFFRVKVDGAVVYSTDRAQTAWTQVNLGLGSWLGASRTLRFEFGTDTSVTREGAYLDDIVVTAEQSSNSDDNDQISEAIYLGAMTEDRTWQTGTIDLATDVDMFSFTVTAGQRVAFDVDRLSGGLDSYLRLFNSNGSQLDFDDDGDERDAAGEAGSLDSYFEYTFRNAGTYYLGFSSYGNSSYNPLTGIGDQNGSTGSYRLTLTAMVDIRALTSIGDYAGHLGNDYNTDSHNPQQDVGRVAVAPVSGRVVFFGRYGSGAGYGDLLVGIEVPIPMSTYRQREDGIERPFDSGFMTVFIGHMTTRRYNSAGVLDDTAPQITLNVGDQVVAGQTHIGYVAPDGRFGTGSAPHIHVGVLPYSENASGFAQFETQTGTRTHFPGFWNTNDTRTATVDDQPSTYYDWVRSILIAPPTTWDGWQMF